MPHKYFAEHSRYREGAVLERETATETALKEASYTALNTRSEDICRKVHGRCVC